jgi:transcription elongation factor Elf1
MKAFYRPKPTWISTRVPIDTRCPECGGKHAAQFVGLEAERTYKYSCTVCGASFSCSLEELNEPPTAA